MLLSEHLIKITKEFYAKFLGIIFERKLQEEKGRVKAAILGVERLNDCVDFNARFKHDV